jgi:prepilin-type N-terminal cleavage/methylation domain-containing protein
VHTNSYKNYIDGVKAMKAINQKGFTLVEIAIVLVIIGLLLGGILKGQELINSARVRNLADQNSGIQAAYYGFIDRYRQVPGDWSGALASVAIGVSVIGGDGNSRIDNETEEGSAVWAQLARSNFLGGGFSPAAANAGNTNDYIAASPKNAFNGTLTLTRNAAYTGTTSTRLNLHLGNNVPVAIARELDVKVDDSKPNTGILRLGAADGVFNSIHGADSNCPTSANDDADYDIANDAQNCGQVFLY